MKDNKKTLIATIIILVIAIAGFIGYKAWHNSQKVAGEKTIVVNVVNESENYNKEHSCKTNTETLGAVLDELGIIQTQDGEFGRWLEGVDNMKADANKQEWWRIQVNGEDAQTGMDLTPIKDKDVIELRLMIGW